MRGPLIIIEADEDPATFEEIEEREKARRRFEAYREMANQ